MLLNLICPGQNNAIDTIFCSLNNTSTMVFKGNVSLLNIGNPDDFNAEIKTNIVNIKPVRANVPSTTLLIKSGDEVFYGTLAYLGKNRRFFYDLTGPKKTQETGLNKATNEAVGKKEDSIAYKQKHPDKTLNEKIEEFGKLKAEIVTLGCISPTFTAAVTVIRNDKDYTYLKLVLKNKSSIPFRLDFISFQYFEEMKKGSFKQSKKAPIDVFPMNDQPIKEITPGSTQGLVYAIPIWALSDNGYLMILIREEKGNRKLKIKIDGATIQNANQF